MSSEVTDAGAEAGEPDPRELAERVIPGQTPVDFGLPTESSRRNDIYASGLKQFFEQRQRWSFWLIFWICSIIAFQIGLTVAIGLGSLDFAGYDWFLPLVVAQNFVQVISMALIVVKFLHRPAPGEESRSSEDF